MNKKYFETKTGSLEEKITQIAKEQPTITKQEPQIKLEVKNTYFDTKPGSIADVAAKIVSEGLDPVNKDAVKKKFDDRKDKDIDNDGDVDSSDKFLHKRRKAISKAVKEEKDCGPGMYYCKTSGTCKPLSMKKEAVMPDDKGEKINQMKHQKAKEGEKEIVKPVSEKVECPQCKGKGCDHCNGKGYHMKEIKEVRGVRVKKTPAQKMMLAKDRIQKLSTNINKTNPSDPKQRSELELKKSELQTRKLKLQKLQKKTQAARLTSQKTYSELRKETKEIQLGDKGKTLTGKNAPKIDVEPRAKPI